MKALILETSGPLAWVARTDGKEILEYIELPGAQGLSSRLHPALEKLMKGHPIDLIAAGVGPGSYAGSRTAATIAKSLSFALGKPLISFPSPLAFIPPGKLGRFAYIADAKMGQIAVFYGEVGERTSLEPFQLLNKENLTLPSLDFVVCEPNCRLELPSLLPTPNPSLIAEYILEKFQKRQFCPLDELRPVYFR